MSRAPAPKTTKPAPRRVSRPQDRDEGEARRAADVVARGGSVAGWSFSTVSPTVQRQEAEKPKTDEEKYKEAAEKAGEAALETPQGQALKKKVLADPLVKPVVDAVTSTPGLIATGAVLGGGVAALAATGKELPIQVPEIPLDRFRPGMSATVVWKGPVNAPTSVGLTLTFREQGPKSKGGGKPAAEGYRAETARIRAEQQQFGRGAVAPGSKEAEEQRQSDEAIAQVVAQQTGRFGLTIPLTPPAAEQKEEEQAQAPVQPEPASPSVETPAQAHVDGALASPGRPLDGGTRRSMEARFGHDFSRVRVHDDARASATADELNASAFTVGEDIAFASGRYDPAGREGRRLLAHELAHVVQQAGGALPRKAAASSAVPQAAAPEPSPHAPEAQPLPPATRRDLEGHFGRPLGDVRIHTGAEGRRVASSHSAVAVAKGSEIFFASGAWAPGTDVGDRILRHEVAHLLQARLTGIGGGPWPEPVLEAEADLAASKPGAVAVHGRARADQPLLMKTFVSTVGGLGYLEAAVKFYKLWEGEDATRIDSYQDIVTELATATSALPEFRIVAHGNEYNLFLALLGKGKDYADLAALGLQTQEQLAVQLGNRAHVTSDETDRVFNWLSKDKEAAPLLARLGLTAAPTGMLKEFVWWVVDEHFAVNAKESGSGVPSTPADQKALAGKVTEAQEATKDLAAAGLPAKATKADLDELRTRTLGAFAKDGWTWTVAPGDIKEKLGRFGQPDTAALLREVKAGTFETQLKAVKNRVSDKTYIEIRGCNVGKNDPYLNGVREFFGTKPDKLPSISAPTLYQFFGTPGAQVLPEGGKKTPPVAESLKFLFEETFDDKSTAKEVQTAVAKARLTSVGGLADVLRHADIKAEFEKWWQMKQAKAGAKTPIPAATLKDFQDFLTTAPPGTFPVNAPGMGSQSLWFLILIPSTAIPALLAWVKDQGYSLPGAEDLAKRFFGGSTKWDPKKFQEAQSAIFVDWLGDDYPVPKNIYFPEDPEYKKNFRRLP